MHLSRSHSGLSMPAGDFGAAVQNGSHSVPDIVLSKMFHSGLTLSGGLSQSFSEQALATASLAQSSPHSPLLHGADIAHQLQLALAQKISENQQLQQRVQDLDAQLQQQRDSSNAQANDIKKLAGQLVLLEEKLNYTTACSQRLQEDNQRLSNHNEHLQQQAADLQQQLAAALSLQPTAFSPTADSVIGTDLFLRTHTAAAAVTDGQPSTAATPTASPPPADAISGSSISAFAAAAAAAEDHQAAAAAAGYGNGANSSTSSTPIPTAAAAGQPGFGMSRALSMGHTPISHHHPGVRNTIGGGFGSSGLSPHHMPLSPERPTGTVSLLLESLQEQSNNLPPSPTAQRSGQLSHALSMSAAAPAGGGSSTAQQQQQHSNSSSIQDFTRDAEVWLPGPPRPHRTQSLLSARDLTRELNSITDPWITNSSSSSSTTPVPAAAIPISSSSSRPIPSAAPTAPQPILAHQHNRRAHAHPAAAAAASSGLGASAFDGSWAGAGLAPLSHSVGAAAGSSGLGFGFSPASYGDPGFLGGRQNSMLDAAAAAAAAAVPAAAAATPGHSESVAAADFLGYSASLGNMAAAAGLGRENEALLQLGGIEHSLALTAAAAAAAAAGLPSVPGGNGASVQNLQALLLLQQQQQLQQHQQHQQIMTAAVAAAAAATAAQQQQIQQQMVAAAAYAAGGATVRGGKPVPGVAAAMQGSGSSSLGGHPMHIPNAQSAAAAAAKGGSSVDDVVSRGGRSYSSGRENGLLLGSYGGAEKSIPANIVQKWDDTWGPEIDRTNSADAEQPDTDDSCDQDAPHHQHNNNSVTNSVTFASSGLQRSASSAAAMSGPGGLILPSGGSSSSNYGLATSASARELSSSSSMNLASAAAAADADGEGGLGQELDAAAQNARLRSKEDACPNTCVYVGFLGWWVTERDLVEYFSPYGELVSVRLLISKKSRRSREQAFVEYADVDQAQKAITWLDTIDYPALVKQLGCGGLVVRFADRKKPAFES